MTFTPLSASQTGQESFEETFHARPHLASALETGQLGLSPWVLVKFLANEQKLSQNQLARKAKIDPSHFSKLTLGKKPLSVEHMVLIAAALGKDSRYIWPCKCGGQR